MGAAVALEQSRSAGGLLENQQLGDGEKRSYENLSEEKRILMMQASANWHKMIVHANEKKSQNNRNEEAYKRVEESMGLYLAASAAAAASAPSPDGKDSQMSQNELSFNSTPNISRVSSSRELKQQFQPTTTLNGAGSESPKPKIAKQKSIQAMGAQFRREELERIRQEEEKANSAATNSPNSKKSSKTHSTNKNKFHEAATSTDLENLPPVRIDLKSRTSTSICLVWDVDFEALSALQFLFDQEGNHLKPLYHLVYRLTAPHEYQLLDGSTSTTTSTGSRRGGGGSQWKCACDDYEGTMMVIKDLQPNTSYTFRCLRRHWSNKWGPEVTIRTGPGVPSCPLELQPNEITSTTVLLTWLSPERDNGLPIIGYLVRMKPFGGNFVDLYEGKNRVCLASNLLANSLYIFEVYSRNRVGLSQSSERLAVRTLHDGAPTMSSWVETIDSETNKIFYLHLKTKATSWTLPNGALLDRKRSFQNKVAYFYSNIQKLSKEAKRTLPIEQHNVRLSLHRENLLEETLTQLRLPSTQELLAGPLRISFVNEEGIDGGGLSREWCVQMMKLLLYENSGLLTMNNNGGETDDRVILDMRAQALHGPDCRWLFATIGKFIAKIIIDELAVGVKFSDLFLNWLSGRVLTLEELKILDPVMYRGLEWVLKNPIDGSDLTFSASFELLGATEVVDFLPNGRNIPVVEENKERYVELMMAWLIQGRYEPALSHFLSGFQSLIPSQYLANFHLNELQELIGGQIEIDLVQLMSTACYTGLIFPSTLIPSCLDSTNPNSPMSIAVVRWFWEYLHEMDLETFSLLLSFITGCSSLPSCGLKPPLTITILDNNSDSLLTIEENLPQTQQQSQQWSSSSSLLPVAHTCFNQIVLPNYGTEEILREKLNYALKNTGQGFHLK